MEKNYKLLIFFIVAGILLAVIGSTFAYWRWSTNSAQNTAVTFTVSSDFSCSADGGGNITSSDKILAPATCTDTTYAIKRTVVVDVTKNGGQDVYLDLKLKVNSIAAELSASENFKYALTTSSSSCTSNVIATGTFNGATANSEKSLLNSKQYAATNHADTYYLWIWLDTSESNNNTQNKAFSLSLTGSCTTQEPDPYVYTANIGSDVTIGQAIPNNITIYNTPEEAMTVLKAANIGDNNYAYFLRHKVVNDIVTESYVGYYISPALSQSFSGLVSGIHYIRGGDSSQAAFDANQTDLINAFSSNNCSFSAGVGYCSVSVNSTSGYTATSFNDDVGAGLLNYVDDGVIFQSFCMVAVTGESHCALGS